MFLISINAIFLLFLYESECESIDSNIKNYFKKNKEFQDIWKKYKRGIETSLEEMLRENYHDSSMNLYVRRSSNDFELAEGFLESSDSVVEVLFRDLYLMELPKMRYPKVSLPLAANLLQIDSELTRVKVMAKYMVYRNQSVIVFADDKETMLKVSPFSLEQVQNTGEVTILGDECRITGHAIATLSDQSVNLGHNTYALTGCKFTLEIWTPGQGSAPVFAPYFNDCDGALLQNLISKPIRDELASKLQGGMYSFINVSEIFHKEFYPIRQRQLDLFLEVNDYLTEVVNNLNVITTNNNQGVATLSNKYDEWTTKLRDDNIKHFVSIHDISLYGLDTAYAGQNGGPYQINGTTNVEVPIGFTALQITGKIKYGTKKPKKRSDFNIFKFSAELRDFSVVINIEVKNGLKANSYPSRGKQKQAWYSPQIRAFELNHYDVESIWSRALLTGHLTNEVYTAVVRSILTGQLNSALQNTSGGGIESVKIPKDLSIEENKKKLLDSSTENTDTSADVDDKSQQSVSEPETQGSESGEATGDNEVGTE